MPGTRITKEQVLIYMKSRKIGNTQKLSAAKTGISERSGRDIGNNKHWTQKEKTPRAWKTRQDPFEEIWKQDIIPMLQRGIYEATFMLEELQKKHPDKFFNSHLRSLQRKVKQWRALFGKDKEVMFRQKNEPGNLGVSDFTHPGDSIKITINGEYLEHIFYHFRLPYSGYNYMQVFKGSGEPFDALVQKLQVAHREHKLSELIAKLAKFDLFILDDIGYVKKSEAETSVLFELIADRYESGSLLITSNQSFSQWDTIFPSNSMAVAGKN